MFSNSPKVEAYEKSILFNEVFNWIQTKMNQYNLFGR